MRIARRMGSRGTGRQDPARAPSIALRNRILVRSRVPVLVVMLTVGYGTVGYWLVEGKSLLGRVLCGRAHTEHGWSRARSATGSRWKGLHRLPDPFRRRGAVHRHRRGNGSRGLRRSREVVADEPGDQKHRPSQRALRDLRLRTRRPGRDGGAAAPQLHGGGDRIQTGAGAAAGGTRRPICIRRSGRRDRAQAGRHQARPGLDLRG